MPILTQNPFLLSLSETRFEDGRIRILLRVDIKYKQPCRLNPLCGHSDELEGEVFQSARGFKTK